jgi:pimeloyl-ACP methyl ester carboxylesterase
VIPLMRAGAGAREDRSMLEVAAAALALAAGPPALPLKPCTLQQLVPARCGTLAVPEDRRAPRGRKIKLFVGIVPAYGPKPHAEPIVWLSGGPGGAAASDDAAFAADTFLIANRTRDLVLVDQRGVGRSTPLVCPQPPPATTIEQALEYARSCLRGVKRDPRLYTTDAAMDDVDAVRKALGYRKIVVYGGSYGGTAAQVYLARHGGNVAAAVLDGATLLDVPLWERMPLSTQEAFDKLVARCAATTACRSTFPDVAGDLRTILERLRSAPVDVRVDGGTARFDVVAAQNTLRFMLRVPETAAHVPRALRRAAAGDLEPLTDVWRAVVRSELGTGVKLMYWAIRCAEGWSRDDPAEAARLGAGTSFLEAALADAESQRIVCSLLPKPLPAPDTGVVPRSRVPVLFLVGDGDPQDPLANVAHARRSLVNAHILVVPGAGHGSIHLGCISSVANRFFAKKRLQASDRACAAGLRPPPFATLP